MLLKKIADPDRISVNDTNQDSGRILGFNGTKKSVDAHPKNTESYLG